MARLGLVKVGGSFVSPRGVRAIEEAENGSLIVYEDGVRVGILHLSPDAIFAALSEAVDRGASSGLHLGGWREGKPA